MTYSDNSARTGRYVRRLNGYRAFMPAQLPPDPLISLEGGLQQLPTGKTRLPEFSGE